MVSGGFNHYRGVIHVRWWRPLRAEMRMTANELQFTHGSSIAEAHEGPTCEELKACTTVADVRARDALGFLQQNIVECDSVHHRSEGGAVRNLNVASHA